ncbi:hypothetical protein H4Q26_012131 [Puccinia striiformis f. sp. tritici PST-130]|nr:hypothetical protein H4Q26_012131 [Puccinia striiformis f. sp. tritici PST-130]
MSNGNSSTGGGYNYYQSSDLQAYQQSTSYNQANSYYDPAAIAIANATGNMAGHHHHQIGSNSGYNHHSKSIDPNFDANVAAQQSIYTPDATAIHHQQIQNQQQNQQNQHNNNHPNKLIRNSTRERLELLSFERPAVSKQTNKNIAHFRLFVGDLAPEVSDDGLAAAFSKWSSFVKARVVRDKVTTKSKGYGPIKISKATTKVGVVQIGNKKARALDDHRKKKLIQGVERLRTGAGAVWKNDNRPYARR